MPTNCSFATRKMTNCLDSTRYENSNVLVQMPYVLHLVSCYVHILTVFCLSATAGTTDAAARCDSERRAQNRKRCPTGTDRSANACTTSGRDIAISAKNGRPPREYSNVPATHFSHASGKSPRLTGANASPKSSPVRSRTGPGASSAGHPRVERFCCTDCGRSGAQRSASLAVLRCSSDQLLSRFTAAVASIARC